MQHSARGKFPEITSPVVVRSTRHFAAWRMLGYVGLDIVLNLCEGRFWETTPRTPPCPRPYRELGPAWGTPPKKLGPTGVNRLLQGRVSGSFGPFVYFAEDNRIFLVDAVWREVSPVIPRNRAMGFPSGVGSIGAVYGCVVHGEYCMHRARTVTAFAPFQAQRHGVLVKCVVVGCLQIRRTFSCLFLHVAVPSVAT